MVSIQSQVNDFIELHGDADYDAILSYFKAKKFNERTIRSAICRWRNRKKNLQRVCKVLQKKAKKDFKRDGERLKEFLRKVKVTVEGNPGLAVEDIDELLADAEEFCTEGAA